jgi:hypothetical protein
MNKALMVKQFVAVIQGRWCRFMVFETGSPRYYLFAPLDDNGCQGTLQFPVLKMDLQPRVRRALAHGWGNANLWKPTIGTKEEKGRRGNEVNDGVV